MPSWLVYTAFAVVFVLVGTAVFFFTLTRGALILRAVTGRAEQDDAHVYPIYSNMGLIKLVDFQPVIAAILLFQYDLLVSAITHGLSRMNLRDKKVLITSCAFGNVIPRVVKAAVESGVQRVLIADIIQNELTHAEGKVSAFPGKTEYLNENAVGLKQADETVAANVIFFLLHELPHDLKGAALKEAVRVLEPGGTLFLAEFHRPDPRVLRALSWTYFKVFEPLGLALWNTHDPVTLLNALGNVTCKQRTVFFGNFQIVEATKRAS